MTNKRIHLRRFPNREKISGLLIISLVCSTLVAVAIAQNPAPLIYQPLIPDAKVPGGAPFTLAVNGTGFVPGAVVHWNGLARTTNFISSSRLTAAIPAADIAKASTASVTVANPGPGGGTSNAVPFKVSTNPALIAMGSLPRDGLNDPFTWVAVGDFNSDSNLDLAEASASGVSILLGNGDGSFQTAVNYDTGMEPSSVATGDFNHDGKLDLVVANQSSHNISILLGNGNGTFQPAANVGVGSAPIGVAVGDFNRDGKLDIAEVNYGDDNVGILLGEGNGAFQTAVYYNVQPYPSHVAVGDFNRDGKLDLAVANWGSDTVSILSGNGDGTFRPAVSYPAGSAPYAIAVGDFNADRKLDLALVDEYSDSVSILLGNGDGTFQTAVSYGAGSTPYGVAVGDFNGDGKLDLAVASGDGGSILLGNGDGTFQPAADYSVGSQTSSVAVGDFNHDGRLDLAFASPGNLVLLQNGLGFAYQLVSASSVPQPMTLSNTKQFPVGISSISISGTDASDFSQTNDCGLSIPPEGFCTVNVTFTPSEFGARTATLITRYNRSGSPQVTALSGTGTVAQLVPAKLSFGKISIGARKSLATTLTNTGTAPMHLANIGIIGTDVSFFTQTNNCPGTLGAGSRCTITVTFSPTRQGSFFGAVSVSDDGGGSPQMAVVAGAGTTNGLHSRALATLAATQTARAPVPAGTSPVGTQVADLVDSTQSDPFLANGSHRELLVRFWYPALLNRACQPAEYASPKVWDYYSQLTDFPLPKITTNSCLDAPVAEGSHPVIVLTPGYTGTFTDYTFLSEDLASRGYIVAAVDHTYEATAVELPDGRMVKSVFGSHLAEDTWRHDPQSLASALSVRLKDLPFIVDELARLNGESSGPFAGKLDMDKVAVAGHSLGGLTALLGVEQEKRFKAAILLDAITQDGSAKPTSTPVLLLAMGRKHWSDEECRLWSDLRGPRFAVNLQGAEHVTPSDAVWLADGAVATGTMGTEKTIAAVRDFIAAFLDVNLRGQPPAALLTGKSSQYPDAVLVTQEGALCGVR